MKKTDRIARGLGTIVAATLLASCTSRANAPAEVSTWSLAASPAVSIGSMTGDSVYLFQNVVAARFLSEGRIAVADGGFHVVRVYDAHGAFLRQMGGVGEGPGEFKSVTSMWTTLPDTVDVWDARRIRMTRFLADGTLVDGHRLTTPGQAPPGGPDWFVGPLSGDETVVAWTALGHGPPSTAPANRMTLCRFGADGVLVDVLGEVPGMRRTADRFRPVVFSPFPWGGVYRDSIYYTDGSIPEISVRDEDGVVGRMIHVPVEAPDPVQAHAAMEAEFQARGKLATLQMFDDKVNADSVPSIARMLLSDDGHIWVKKYDPAADALGLRGGSVGRTGSWLVLTNAGDVEADVDIPDALSPMEIQGDRLLAVHVDSLGVQTVVVRTVEGMGR